MARSAVTSRIRTAGITAALVAVLLSGCDNSNPEPPTFTSISRSASPLTPPVSSAAETTVTHIPRPPSWAGNGVFSVGQTPSGGAKAAIPVGRYQVTLAPNSSGGFWIRCSALPCAPTAGGANVLDIQFANGAGFSSVADVLPSDGAVYLDSVVFTAVQ